MTEDAREGVKPHAMHGKEIPLGIATRDIRAGEFLRAKIVDGRWEFLLDENGIPPIRPLEEGEA